MASEDSSKEDRQLEPSARKLAKAREEGQIARSRDLGHFAVVGAGLGLFVALGPSIAQGSLDRTRGEELAELLDAAESPWEYGGLP